MSSRLVVVSNRVAPIGEGRPPTGGLAVAVHAALKQSGGLWMGWSGDVVEDGGTPTRMQKVGPITYAMLDLSQRDYDEYYRGFSNSTLWPLLHYRLDLTEFDRRTYAGYMRVNAFFAERLAPLLKAEDMIWVHDYHLIPVAEQLRVMGFDNRIGFFLHTPFPVPEVLNALPAASALVKALCAYDVVGFHTRQDCDAFISFLKSESSDCRVDDTLVSAFGRKLHADVYPISIDTAAIESLAARSEGSRQTQRIRESLRGRQMVIGVDRLDYSKGLPQRFLAFQKLLETYAENRQRCLLLQIAPPSRSDVADYQAIRHQLESLAGSINGGFAEFDWMPIRYLNRSFKPSTLLGFFRASRIGLVTPLRDGMNLVAKEYVAAQDPEDPGVLILSRFAGAAAELENGALIVNPYDVEAVAESLERGLTMEIGERRERHGAMLSHLRSHDIALWRNRFVDALEAAPYNER